MSATPGSYILLLRLGDDAEAEVGSLGRLRFSSGWYAYTGSARNGLEARVGRHFSKAKAMRWHIDRLSALSAESLALAFLGESPTECSLAARLIDAGAEPAHKGFGSSDCRCGTHLFRLDGGALRKALGLPCDGVMRPPSCGGGGAARPSIAAAGKAEKGRPRNGEIG